MRVRVGVREGEKGGGEAGWSRERGREREREEILVRGVCGHTERLVDQMHRSDR